ncbi:polysaccharide deacetylase family protein [Caldisericum exile]|uniref:Hydrolase n=1 Tax=Caldisericum exile (strain DSM 21853 / NBRC 104410 / AZM16c01) TaxID=511051 RepID=A0A7U6JFL3_CALEA|nr:polysaccharide deacetylase family protein [Caldisericum exile]BAL81648.1 putative hydrolase [Caldisericum exile AZM16c01]
MKKIIAVFLIVIFLVSLYDKALSNEKMPSLNVPNTYFESALYNLGRIYGIKKNTETLNEYSSLFSSKDTFVLVLMYHNIYTDKKINSYDVSLDDFKKHIEILKRFGFESITLEDLYEFLMFNKRIPKRSVIFTFDDGFKSVVLASMVLKENGFKGATSLITGYIGSTWEVSDQEIQTLLNNGFEISLHSHKLHNIYTKLLKERKYKEIECDIKQSKEYAKNTLHISPIAFTYPQGAYDKSIEEILKKNGFKIGFGLYGKLINRYGDNPLYISRVEISERLNTSNSVKFQKLIEKLIK